jgi:phosphohistidine phosphatase
MLRLALLRHAKSSWDDPDLDDFDRPLNERGRKSAPMMGQMLASLNFKPDAILCSPAKRTRETLDGIQPFLKSRANGADFDRGLYLASAGDILSCIQKSAAAAATVLVIGHNPGMHILSARLAASGDPGAIARLSDKFPTAALAVYSFPQATWAEMTPETGHLEAFITPKDRA